MTTFEQLSEAATIHYEAELDRRLGSDAFPFRAALKKWNEHWDEVFMSNLTGDDQWRSDMWIGRS